jgi:hypothetical protein
MKEHKKLDRKTVDKLVHEGISSDDPRFLSVTSAVIEEIERKAQKSLA